MAPTAVRPGPIPTTLVATSLAAVALGALCWAAPADAGTYVARFCDAGANADKASFERSGNETVFRLVNDCGGANGLRIAHNAGNQGNDGVFARWLATRPEGISVARIDYKAAGRRDGGYFPQVVGEVPGGDQGLSVIQGEARLTGGFGDLSVDGDVSTFGIQLVCQTDGSACGTDPSNPDVKLKDVTYTLHDPGAPTIQVTGGTLFEAPIQTGVQTIDVSATDAGSGVHRIVVQVNGDEALAWPAGCALGSGFALSFKPCPPSLAGSVGVNTAAGGPWENGVNRVQVCAEDLATSGAPNRTCTPTQTVRVLNGCGANAASPSGAQTLTLEWPGKRNAAAQTRQGRSRTAIATLFGPGGAPLSGATVCFSRTIPKVRGAERVIEPAAVTGPDGSVAVKIRGASSRGVHATYLAGPEAIITDSIELDVAPRIKLGVRPERSRLESGRPIKIVAVLRGKWKADRRVCFYEKRPGNDRIGCDDTGDGGRAVLGHRPRDAGATWFYAKVPNQRGFPYTNKRSKKVARRVVP